MVFIYICSPTAIFELAKAAAKNLRAHSCPEPQNLETQSSQMQSKFCLSAPL